MLIFNHTYHIFASLYIATTILNIDKILNLQNKRIRIMMNLNKNDPVKEQFKKLGNVDKLGIVHLQHCVVVFKYLTIISTNKNIPRYNTRRKLSIINLKL